MIAVSIARRYAKALFDLAAADNQLEPVGQAFDSVARAVAQCEALRDVLANPAFTNAARKAVLGKLLGELQAPELAVHAMKLLIDRGRSNYIEAVARELRTMLDAHLGRLRAKVTSAIPLDARAAEAIRAQIATATNKQVSVDAVVDPSILGGVVAQVGSITYDGSLQTQLEKLKRQLLYS